MSDRPSYSASAPPIDTDQAEARKAAVARLDELWRLEPHDLTSQTPLLGEAKRAANSLTRWYVLPIVEQQNAFNAALVHAIQQLSEAIDSLSANVPALQAHADQLRVQTDQLRVQAERLAHQQAPLHQHIADIEQHLCDIDDAQTSLAERLTRPEAEVE